MEEGTTMDEACDTPDDNTCFAHKDDNAILEPSALIMRCALVNVETPPAPLAEFRHDVLYEAVSIFLLVHHQFQRINQVPAEALRYCMRFGDLGLVDTFACLHHQEPVWLLPIMCVSTDRAPPLRGFSSMHYPDLLDDYLNENLVETEQSFFKKEPMDAPDYSDLAAKRRELLEARKSIGEDRLLGQEGVESAEELQQRVRTAKEQLASTSAILKAIRLRLRR